MLDTDFSICFQPTAIDPSPDTGEPINKAGDISVKTYSRGQKVIGLRGGKKDDRKQQREY